MATSNIEYLRVCDSRMPVADAHAAAVSDASVGTFASGWDAAMQSTAVDMKFVIVVKSSADIQSGS
jgi:hypothetical protein